MPTIKTHGTATAANEAIGGIPVIHYFDWFSRGRGQVLRLLWEDAGMCYTDVRYTFEEYPQVKRDRISKLNPTSSIPVVELNGAILTQSYAILRKMSRLLGKYDGETEDEKYWVDAMCDIAIDCTATYVFQLHVADKVQGEPFSYKPGMGAKKITPSTAKAHNKDTSTLSSNT